MCSLVGPGEGKNRIRVTGRGKLDAVYTTLIRSMQLSLCRARAAQLVLKFSFSPLYTSLSLYCGEISRSGHD